MAPRDRPSTSAATSSTGHHPVATHRPMATAATAVLALITPGVPHRLVMPATDVLPAR